MTRSKRITSAITRVATRPINLFAGDQKPGDIEGQGSTAFGGGWFALNRAGDQVSSRASSSSTNSSSAGGYAY